MAIESARPPREIILINRSEPSEKSFWDRVEKPARILSLIAIPFVLGVGGWIIQATLSDRSVSKDYVELSMTILTKSDEAVDPRIRDWAVSVLEEKSPITLDPEVLKELSSGAIRLPKIGADGGDHDFFRDFAVLSQNISKTGVFAEALLPTAEAYYSFLTWVNHMDADTNLRLAQIDPTNEVDPLDIIDTTFAEGGLEVRLELIETVLLYSQALASAADTDLTNKFNEEASAFRVALENLSSSAEQLAQGETTHMSFGDGHLAKMVKDMGSIHNQGKPAAAIRDSIVNAEPVIRSLISQIQDDAQIAFLFSGPTSAMRLAAASRAYNNRIGTKGFTQEQQDHALHLVLKEYENYKNGKVVERQIVNLAATLMQANRAFARYAVAESEAVKQEALKEALTSVRRLSLQAQIVRNVIGEMRA